MGNECASRSASAPASPLSLTSQRSSRALAVRSVFWCLLAHDPRLCVRFCPSATRSQWERQVDLETSAPRGATGRAGAWAAASPRSSRTHAYSSSASPVRAAAAATVAAAAAEGFES